MFTSISSFERATLQRVFTRTFIAAFALSLAYFALAYWQVLQDPAVSNPGQLILACSTPWSITWLDRAPDVSACLTSQLQAAISVAVIPAAFALNLATALTLGAALWQMVTRRRLASLPA